MRAGIDVGIDPDGDVGPDAELACDGVQRLEFGPCSRH